MHPFRSLRTHGTLRTTDAFRPPHFLCPSGLFNSAALFNFLGTRRSLRPGFPAQLVARVHDGADNGPQLETEAYGDFSPAHLLAAQRFDFIERVRHGRIGFGVGLRQALRHFLVEDFALGGKQHHRLRRPALRAWRHSQRLQALKDRFRLQDHAFAAAEGAVIHGAVPVVGGIAQVVQAMVKEAGFDVKIQSTEFATSLNLLRVPTGTATLDQLETANVASLESLSIIVKPIDHIRVTLPAGPAIRFTYGFRVANSGIANGIVQTTQYLIPVAGVQYIVTLSSGGPPTQQEQADFLAVARSFTVLP